MEIRKKRHGENKRHSDSKRHSGSKKHSNSKRHRKRNKKSTKDKLICIFSNDICIKPERHKKCSGSDLDTFDDCRYFNRHASFFFVGSSSGTDVTDFEDTCHSKKHNFRYCCFVGEQAKCPYFEEFNL